MIGPFATLDQSCWPTIKTRPFPSLLPIFFNLLAYHLSSADSTNVRFTTHHNFSVLQCTHAGRVIVLGARMIPLLLLTVVDLITAVSSLLAVNHVVAINQQHCKHTQ